MWGMVGNTKDRGCSVRSRQIAINRLGKHVLRSLPNDDANCSFSDLDSSQHLRSLPTVDPQISTSFKLQYTSFEHDLGSLPTAYANGSCSDLDKLQQTGLDLRRLPSNNSLVQACCVDDALRCMYVLEIYVYTIRRLKACEGRLAINL